ncbi:MAG: recombinase family protein, partial [Elusimicrobiota bacterium]
MDVERSKDFHLARARKGLWSAGLPPLGYDIKDKMLVVNEAEAELVRRIFDLYLKHESAIRVAEELNRLGYRRKAYRTKDDRLYGGKPFDLDSVVRTLQRKAYIGLITNERTGKEFPGQHKPIIAPDLFDRVQEVMAGHNHRGGEIHYVANRHGFLLKGLIRCGVCGGAVVGHARIKKGKTYRYYKCLAERNGVSEKCAFGSVNADKIEEYVVEKLAALGWDRPFLERVVRKADELVKASIRPLEKERREVADQLQVVGNEVRQLLDLAKRSESREAAEELRRAEAAKRELEVRAAQLDAQLAFRKRVVYDVDAVEGALRRFALLFRRLPLPLQVRMIQLLVERVVVRRDQTRAELHEVAISDFQRALDKKEPVASGP